MICSTLRQISSLVLLSAGMMHVGLGLKLSVFQSSGADSTASIVVALMVAGFLLWTAGCKLAAMGATLLIASKSCGSVLAFPASLKVEKNGTCTKEAA